MTAMMIERHYDDEALIALMESDRLRSDAHLPACDSCSEKLESYQLIADALHDGETWDTREARDQAVPSTIANLRAFANRMTADDAQAEIYLQDLLAGSREQWMPRLREHPEWRTAGVVRKLVASTDHAIDTMPPDALELTGLATEIADHLDPVTHPSDMVAHLRGAAWRERAYALFYTGEFSKAAVAVDRADAEFAKCVVDEYDRARVGIVKALVLRPLDRLSEASRVALASSDAFRQFGDVRRMASAAMAEVHLLASRSDYAGAIRILESLEKSVREGTDAAAHALVAANLGYCTWKSGKRDAAIRHYEIASAINDALGIYTGAVRNRWNIAAILAEDGRLSEANERLRRVIPELERLSMNSEAALASLDLAELLLIENRHDEVDAICRAAMASFERAGVAYTQRAHTALAYMREAAQQRVANPTLVRQVRDFIRRLPHEPNLLFARPPE